MDTKWYKLMFGKEFKPARREKSFNISAYEDEFDNADDDFSMDGFESSIEDEIYSKKSRKDEDDRFDTEYLMEKRKRGISEYEMDRIIEKIEKMF